MKLSAFAKLYHWPGAYKVYQDDLSKILSLKVAPSPWLGGTANRGVMWSRYSPWGSCSTTWARGIKASDVSPEQAMLGLDLYKCVESYQMVEQGGRATPHILVGFRSVYC